MDTARAPSRGRGALICAPPLTGRDEELARLMGVLQRARGGAARTVPVARGVGAGRTRLLAVSAGDAVSAVAVPCTLGQWDG
ncbi:hypothetical protein [Streptomyces sp. NPDC048191]|uniref:hypothetical protein n=1 Tax=Streptomyces sp. NPDC048191 TaxID=3155484 RepID=UPI0033DB5D6E